MEVIRDILFPKSFDSVWCQDCDHIEMPTESRQDVATNIPIRAGMTLCESISYHFSSDNWKPSRGTCIGCSADEEKEIRINPAIQWTDVEQNIFLVKPTFEDGLIGTPNTKVSNGSDALINGDKFQCVGCVILDSDKEYSLFVKRLGDWYQLQGMETPIFQFHIDEPKDGLFYLFMKDVPDYI